MTARADFDEAMLDQAIAWQAALEHDDADRRGADGDAGRPRRVERGPLMLVLLNAAQNSDAFRGSERERGDAVAGSALEAPHRKSASKSLRKQ